MCARKIGFKYDTCKGVHVSWLNIVCNMCGTRVLCLTCGWFVPFDTTLWQHFE